MSMMNPYAQYFENRITTATPGKILIMTFEAALRFAKTAREKMLEHDLEGQNTYIGKVQSILVELMGALNHDAAPKLAASLDDIYTYAYDTLTTANLRDNVALMDEVIELISSMYEVWTEAEASARMGAESGTKAA